jgi:hypothetical protein
MANGNSGSRSLDFTSEPPNDLPILMPPRLTAEILQCSEKTLERRRRDGKDGLPFVKIRRRILYPRDLLLNHVRERVFTSTAEAKQAEVERVSAGSRIV